MSLGMTAWKLSFQLSPIILTNGVAAIIPGGMLPIIAITEALNFTAGILSSGDNIGLDNFFANYSVISGNTLIEQQIGKYPFANQAVAANAVISQPLKVSLLMDCPARGSLGYAVKLATMMALQTTLEKHNSSGGTYTVITPAAFYDNCVMTSLADVTGGDPKQPQSKWRWDFEQPLLTQKAASIAEQALNTAMGKIGLGVQTDGALSGLGSNIAPAFNAVGTSVVPSASGVVGATAGLSFGPLTLAGIL